MMKTIASKSIETVNKNRKNEKAITLLALVITIAIENQKIKKVINFK